MLERNPENDDSLSTIENFHHPFNLIDPNGEFISVSSALDAVLDQCILKVLVTPLQPRASIISSSIDIFKKNNKYSLEMVIKIIVALGIGGLTALFNLVPSKEAIKILALIAKYYDKTFPNQKAWIRFVRVTTVSRSNLLCTYSAVRLIQAYFPNQKPTAAELFLRKESATCLETTGYYTRTVGSLVSASCANIPVLLFSLNLGIPLGISITLAAVAIGWLGVNNITQMFRRYQPAHRTELNYLRKQIKEFSQLSPETKQHHIQALQNILDQGGHPQQIRKSVFLYLLKLGTSANPSSLKVPEESWKSSFVAYTFGILGVIPQLTFTESTIKGVANLKFFDSPTSAKAISAATLAGLFSVVPAIGIGKGGYDGGRKLMSDAKPIANDYHRVTRKLGEYGMILWNIIAFSTIITFAYNCMKDLTDLADINKKTSLYLEMTFMGVCFLGSTINLSYYFIVFLQMIFAFYAMRNGNDNMRLQALFESGMQGFLQNLENMSDLNFLRLLKSQITTNENSSAVDIELSHVITQILRSYLQVDEYTKVINDLNNLNEEIDLAPKEQCESKEKTPGYVNRILTKMNVFHPKANVPTTSDMKEKNSIEMSIV